jgi:hemerythrin superfamily protein
VEEEEGELFPKIEKALGQERLEEMGRRMQQVKDRLSA